MEIAPALLGLVADMHLHLFVQGMQRPTWVSAQCFVGALHFFLTRNTSAQVGIVRVENEAAFPSDHYSVRLRLFTLLA